MCPSGRSPLPEAADARPHFRTAFDVLDADRDGKISREDLRSLCASGFSAADDEDVIGSMISAADSNNDGFVEYEEFARVLGCGEGASAAAAAECAGGGGVMAEAFRVMDRDGDGRVGFEDLRSYMKWAGFAASDEDLKAMINLGGGDEREGVTYDGLLKILAVDCLNY